MAVPQDGQVLSQSTKPFHADTETRRAVSTVPPITTSFYSNRQIQRCPERDMGRRRTKVSWIAPVFIPRGDRMFLSASMAAEC